MWRVLSLSCKEKPTLCTTFSISSTSTCFGHIQAHHQEVQPYVHNSWYLYFLDDCLLSWLDWNPSRTRTTDSRLKRIIRTSCCIHMVVPPDDGPRYARNMQRLMKYTNFTVVLAFSIPLCSNYSILVKPSNTTKYVSLSFITQQDDMFRSLIGPSSVLNLLKPNDIYIYVVPQR